MDKIELTRSENCISILCNKLDEDGCCTVYPYEGTLFRIKQGYCPIPDKYFDPDKQAEYEKQKGMTGKARIGQQKTRRNK